MFGMGFSELLIIAVIAILFLGPDKLPSALVDITKFFKNIKKTVDGVKNSINDEIHLEDIKKEAQAYKQQLLEAQSKVNNTVNLEHLDDEINSIVQTPHNERGFDPADIPQSKEVLEEIAQTKATEEATQTQEATTQEKEDKNA